MDLDNVLSRESLEINDTQQGAEQAGSQSTG